MTKRFNFLNLITFPRHYDISLTPVIELRRLSRFPAKMTLVRERALISTEKICSRSRPRPTI